MSKLISAITLLLFVSGLIFAQTDKYSKPTVWENYFIKDNNVIAQMPKLPVLNAGSFEAGNSCHGEFSYSLSAYSGGIVYVISIISETKVPEFCAEKRSFDRHNFFERAKYLKKTNETAKVSENGNVTIFANEDRALKLVNDFENKRWFELRAFGADETNAEVKNFLNSLKIGEQVKAREVGIGAPRNYGDDNVSEAAEDVQKKIEVQTDKLKFITKPRAAYTDAARQAKIQGSVSLKVTFLANGGIGDIEPLSTLPYGLTEQAIAAASKIFFIPAKSDGKFYSETKIVEYHFNIF